MADMNDDSLIRLATASNGAELLSWKMALDDGGIRFQIQREHMPSFSSRTQRRQPEIWILKNDLDVAKAILTKHLPRGKTADLYFGW